MINAIKSWLIEMGVSATWAEILKLLIVIVIVFIVSYLANWLTKKFIAAIVSRIVRKTSFTWDDILLKNKVFHRFSHIVPALIIYYSCPLVLKGYPEWIAIVRSMVYIYMIVMAMLIISAFLKALNEIYMLNPNSKDRPIRGFLQVINIFNYSIGFILILSIILQKDPSYFLTGIGALAAVLMLVFKDTLLGLVAGIQLSANEMVKIGDWVVMPSKNADGLVTEITLHTVKVQNWDKTIAMIPSYAMVSESFINYRGMEEAKARRIKRSLFFDINTVRFLTIEEINELKNIALIRDYLINKLSEIEEYNKNLPFDPQKPINGRWLTNIGTFRMYAQEYIKSKDFIRKDMNLMVRQLPPSENGIPLEVYAFSSITEWESFEKVQADIFDHLMAVVPLFYLRIYQNPTGNDFARLLKQ
ncbi:MAG: mechanosensitive ion channel family protein [Bacteroidales bacterium]|nr:mechanosensitive ion channel family protein [Bacteroidales bacterium]